MSRPLVVAIVGPTASGKSALADELAVRLATSVISVDAMQVYRGMDVGTAKTPVEERRAPLLMIDVADVGDDYSVRLFQRGARACIDDLLCAHRLPILCGGTGLYLNAVVDRMEFPAGATESPARERYERYLEQEGSEALYALLSARDPASAALIHPNNTRRVVRALEMLEGGVSYAEHHKGLHECKPFYDARIFGLAMSRERLYRRINERVDLMMEQGLLAEVEALLDRGLGSSATARQAIGYKEILDYLDGACSLDEAVETIKTRSRRYAKRQLSWFRRDGRVSWLDMDAMDTFAAADAVLEGLEERD